MGPTTLRVKGNVALCPAARLVKVALLLYHSAPYTASVERRLGNVRCHPLGKVAPWKFTSRWCRAASLSKSMQYRITGCVSPPKKSIFTPATPIFSHQANSFSRFSGSLSLHFGPGAPFTHPQHELYHSSGFTPFS